MKKQTLLSLLLVSSMAQAKLSSESEFSSVATGGNSQVATYLAKTLNTFEFPRNAIRFGGHYTYGESAQAVSARDWDIYGREEHYLSGKTSLILGEVWEGYRFQGIKIRYNTDLGLRYYFHKSDLQNFFGELGYRYTIEDRYEPETNQYENKIRAYTEYNQKVSETFQYRLWAEYIPNLTDRRDYLLTYEASLTSILTSIFSLKVAYKGIYDQVPAITGNRNYDYSYMTSLVAKF